jgi:hypothetical protein
MSSWCHSDPLGFPSKHFHLVRLLLTVKSFSLEEPSTFHAWLTIQMIEPYNPDKQYAFDYIDSTLASSRHISTEKVSPHF